jgi:hypothetical protein
MAMMPGGGGTQTNATASLASRMSAVRSYVQENTEDSEEDEADSDESLGTTSIDDVPKERAYSVGSKPGRTASARIIRFVGRKVDTITAETEVNGNLPTTAAVPQNVPTDVGERIMESSTTASSKSNDYLEMAPPVTSVGKSSVKRRVSAAAA